MGVRVPLRAIFCVAKKAQEAMHLRASRAGLEVERVTARETANPAAWAEGPARGGPPPSIFIF